MRQLPALTAGPVGCKATVGRGGADSIVATRGLGSILRGLVRRLRRRCPQARLILRGDSGYGVARVLEWCARLGLDYVLGVARNAVLQKLSTPTQMDAALKWAWEGDGCREFGEFFYAAQTWQTTARLIVKAEVTQHTLNPRFVVTSLSQPAEQVYTRYCARGDRENRWKEFKGDLAAGRTSCTTFLANQCRLLWHVAAALLCVAVREAAAGTQWATAQVSTLRTRLFKIAARVIQTARRIYCCYVATLVASADELSGAARLAADRQPALLAWLDVEVPKSKQGPGYRTAVGPAPRPCGSPGATMSHRWKQDRPRERP